MKNKYISLIYLNLLLLMLLATACGNAAYEDSVIKNIEKQENKTDTNKLKEKEYTIDTKALFYSDNAIFKNELSYGGDKFSIGDSTKNRIYIYNENFTLVDTIKNASFDKQVISYTGAEILLQKSDKTSDSHNDIKLYKKALGGNFPLTFYSNLYDGTGKALLIQNWSEQGIYFLTDWSFKEDLSLLNTKRNIIAIYDSDFPDGHRSLTDCNVSVIDVIDGWALLFDSVTYEVYKLNLHTKRKSQIAVLDNTLDIMNLHFFGSPDKLIGNIYDQESGWRIFMYTDNKFKIVQEGLLLTPIKDGFLYKIYDSLENHSGWVYGKKFTDEDVLQLFTGTEDILIPPSVNKYKKTEPIFSSDNYIYHVNSGGDKFSINDYDKDELYIYDKDSNLVEIIENALYCQITISPDGKKIFFNESSLQNPSNDKYYIKTIGEDYEKEFFMKSINGMNTPKWLNEGIYYFKIWKYCGNGLGLLKLDQSVHPVTDDPIYYQPFYDVIDNWGLRYNTRTREVYKVNLKTKEKITMTHFKYGPYISALHFFNSPDILIGEISSDIRGQEIFIYEDNKISYIQKGSLLSPIEDGFIYAIYKHTDKPETDDYGINLKSYIYLQRID